MVFWRRIVLLPRIPLNLPFLSGTLPGWSLLQVQFPLSVFYQVCSTTGYLQSVWHLWCPERQVRFFVLFAHFLFLSVTGCSRKYDLEVGPTPSVRFSCLYWLFLEDRCKSKLPGNFLISLSSLVFVRIKGYFQSHLLSFSDFHCASFWNNRIAWYYLACRLRPPIILCC